VTAIARFAHCWISWLYAKS